MQIWINGQEQSQLALPNRALAFGEGIFETLRLDQGRLLNLERHTNRAANSAAELNISEYPVAKQTFQEIADKISNQWLVGESGVVKIYFIRKRVKPGLDFSLLDGFDWICEFEPGEKLFGWQLPGAKTGLCETPCAIHPGLAGHNHISKFETVMAAHEVQSRGWDDGMMTDGTFLIGSTTANLFVLQGDQLLTPNLSQSGVNGVMRETILDIGAKIFTSVQVRELHVAELFQSNAAFLTNSILGIWPVASFNYMNHEKKFAEHEGLNKLQQLLKSELGI